MNCLDQVLFKRPQPLRQGNVIGVRIHNPFDPGIQPF